MCANLPYRMNRPHKESSTEATKYSNSALIKCGYINSELKSWIKLIMASSAIELLFAFLQKRSYCSCHSYYYRPLNCRLHQIIFVASVISIRAPSMSWVCVHWIQKYRQTHISYAEEDTLRFTSLKRKASKTIVKKNADEPKGHI